VLFRSQLTYDGALYQQDFKIGECFQSSEQLSETTVYQADEDLAEDLDQIQDDEIQPDEDEIEDMILVELLENRSSETPNKFQFAGLDTTLYPPSALSEEMSLKYHRTIHCQNVWQFILAVIHPNYKKVPETPDISGDLVQKIVDRWAEVIKPLGFSCTLYELHRVIHFKKVEYDCKNLPIIPNMLPISALQDISTLSTFASKMRKVLPNFQLKIIGDRSIPDTSSASNSKGDCEDEIEIWKNHLKILSDLWLHTESTLASSTCPQFNTRSAISSPIKFQSSYKIQPAPTITLRTRFTNTPIILSNSASELYARWHDPDSHYSRDYYDTHSEGFIKNGSGGEDSRLAMQTRRRMVYEQKKRTQSQRNLDELLSQAAASQSQVAAAPIIQSSHVMSSQGGTASKKVKKRGF